MENLWLEDIKHLTEDDVLYFGAWSKDRIGHFLYESGGHCAPREKYPFADNELDTVHCPKTERFQEEGRAQLVYQKGWTLIAYWDRSADTRSNSNSVFLVRGIWEFRHVLEAAKKFFPHVVERRKFVLRCDLPKTKPEHVS